MAKTSVMRYTLKIITNHQCQMLWHILIPTCSISVSPNQSVQVTVMRQITFLGL